VGSRTRFLTEVLGLIASRRFQSAPGSPGAVERSMPVFTQRDVRDTDDTRSDAVSA